MDCREFSERFDTEIAAYMAHHKFEEQESLDSLEFDDYEKSVFLTKAQEQIVLSYYNGNNANGESFEQTEEMRRYLADLVKIVSLNPIGEDIPMGVSVNSTFFTLPEDLWFIIYEAAKVSSDDCHNGKMLDGVPVTHDEYNRVRRNPYRGANGRRVLRLDLEGRTIEVVSGYTVASYYIRYLSRPEPIVLVDLPDGLSINDISAMQTCKLHEALHEKILELAVGMAIRSKLSGKDSNAD